jgi:hypothetical protein
MLKPFIQKFKQNLDEDQAEEIYQMLKGAVSRIEESN